MPTFEVIMSRIIEHINKYEHFFLDKDGLCQGQYIRTHNNKSIHINCFYKDNKLHGEYKEWDEKGNVTHNCLYINGIKSLIVNPSNEEKESLTLSHGVKWI